MRGGASGGRAPDAFADAGAEGVIALARAALQSVEIGEAVEVAVAGKGEQVAGSGVIDARAQQQFEPGVFFEEFGNGRGFKGEGVAPRLLLVLRPARNKCRLAAGEDGLVIEGFDDVGDFGGCCAHARIVATVLRAGERGISIVGAY